MPDATAPKSPLWLCYHCQIATDDGQFCPRCRKLMIPTSAEEIGQAFPGGVVWAGKREGVEEE